MKIFKKKENFKLETEEVFKDIPEKIVVEEEQINEAFRAGKTPEMIVKLMNVIGRKARISDISVSPVPDHYANRYGSFIGFFVGYNNNETLRFNFQRSGASDNFYSIDKYNIDKMMPEYTIDLRGFNVVQVADYVADILSGEFWKYAESAEFSMGRLSERVTFGTSVSEWLSQEPQIKEELKRVLQSRNSSRIIEVINSYLPNFEDFLRQTGQRGSANNYRSLRYHLRRYFENENVDTSGVPSVDVLPGAPESPLSPSSEGEKIFNDLMNNEHIYKFQVLKEYCLEIKRGNSDFRSLYIYGDGGIGKSFWVKKILLNFPKTAYKQGKVSGYTGLVSELYKHREGKILILDDVVNDTDMNNPAFGNILKAALDPDPPRTIEVMRSGRRESYSEWGKFYLNEKDYKEFQKMEEEVLKEQSKLQEEIEFVDVTTPIDTPSRFTFESTVIFITNYKKVPQPIQDRCWFIKMEFTNKQILELIEDSLKRAIPDGDINTLEEMYQEIAPSPTKLEALSILRGMEVNNLVRTKMSFRIFNKAVSLIHRGKYSKEEIIKKLLIQLGN